MNVEKLAQLNMLETLNLTHASDVAQQEAVRDATEIILTSAMDRIKDQFSDDVRAEFERIFSEQGSQHQRDAFLQEHVPDLEDIMIQESLRYKYLTQIIAASVHE